MAASASVLFVCTGNICRSPTAEALARALAEGMGAGASLRFASAGTHGLEGRPATEGSQAAAAEIGVDLGRHRARRLSREMLAAADVVYGMEAEHVAAALDLDPTAVVELLRPDGRPIPDPYGLDLEVYRLVRDDIAAAVRQRLEGCLGR